MLPSQQIRLGLQQRPMLDQIREILGEFSHRRTSFPRSRRQTIPLPEINFLIPGRKIVRKPPLTAGFRRIPVGPLQEAAEWIGTGRPLRGVEFVYRRELSDVQLVLALDRAIGEGEYDDADLDSMAGDNVGWARDAAEHRAAGLDFRTVTPQELAVYEAIVAGRTGYSLGWVIAILRARHRTPAADVTNDGGASCAKCGKPLPQGTSVLARFCSNACRQGDWRARTAVTKSRDTFCAVCGCSIAGPADPHRAGRPGVYCSRACQQRAYRQRREAGTAVTK